MGARRSVRMKLLVAAPLVVVFVVVVLLALRPPSESPIKRVSGQTSLAHTHSALPASPTYHPLRVTPPQTAVE